MSSQRKASGGRSGRPAGPVRGDEPGRSYATGLRAWVESAALSQTQLADLSPYSLTTVNHILSGARTGPLTTALLDKALVLLKLCGASAADLTAWKRFHLELGIYDEHDCQESPPRPPPPPGAAPLAPSSAKLPDAVMGLLARQRDEGESVPYVLPEGRLPQLSDVYVRQLLDLTDEAAAPSGAARSAQDVVTTAGTHVLVVAGPGGGKSTLIRRLVSGFAEPWLHGQGQEPARLVPLWTTAVELSRQTGPIESALSLHALPEGARWLVLVDGVDEIVDLGLRRAFALRLASFARRHRDRLQLLVTTRPLPADERRSLYAAGLEPYALEPFDRSRLVDFANRWFGDRAVAADYVRQVDLTGLGSLVRVPLLATITAVVYEAYPDSPLPASQYLLYEQYRTHLAQIKASQLREQWHRLEAALQNTPRAASAVHRLREQRGEALLHHLATEQMTHGVDDLTRSALSWLDDYLDTPVSRLALGWPEYVRGVLAGTGMLVRTASDIRFLHTSFAEHLTAECHAAQLPDSTAFDDPPWRAVINRACSHDAGALATLIHAAHRSTMLAKALLATLERGTDPERLVAAHLLAEGPVLDDSHAQWFVANLAATDPDLEPDWWRLAARIGHPLVIGLLADLAGQPGEQRYAAAVALCTHRPTEAGGQLLAVVSDPDHSWQTRCDALRTLTQLGDLRARQATEVLREQVLNGSLDRLERKSAIVVIVETYGMAELANYFRDRFTAPNGTPDTAAISAFATLSETHARQAKDHMASLFSSYATDAHSERALQVLGELTSSLGIAAFCETLATTPLTLKEKFTLALVGVETGLNQGDILAAITTELLNPERYASSGDQELVHLAEALREFIEMAPDDMCRGIINRLQQDAFACRSPEESGPALLLALAVLGLTLVSPPLVPANGFAGAFVQDYCRYNATGMLPDSSLWHGDETMTSWVEWLGVVADAPNILTPSRLGRLYSLAVDDRIPREPRIGLLTTLVMLTVNLAAHSTHPVAIDYLTRLAARNRTPWPVKRLRWALEIARATGYFWGVDHEGKLGRDALPWVHPRGDTDSSFSRFSGSL